MRSPTRDTAYVALLRGLNVGGHARIAMADLRAMVARLGFANAQTVLQSGNLVFRGGAHSGRELETTLQRAAARHLNVRADVFVRTADEWARMIASNPFADDAARDPSHLVVVVLKDAPSPAALGAFRWEQGPELVHVAGAHAYVTYPAGIGRSTLTIPVIERALGTRATGRNWNTVLRLSELAHPRADRTRRAVRSR